MLMHINDSLCLYTYNCILKVLWLLFCQESIEEEEGLLSTWQSIWRFPNNNCCRCYEESFLNAKRRIRGWSFSNTRWHGISSTDNERLVCKAWVIFCAMPFIYTTINITIYIRAYICKMFERVGFQRESRISWRHRKW